MQLVLVLLGAYLFGSVPTAYIAVRILKGIDLRRYGSGSVGGSNAGMVLGKRFLPAVALVDILKAALPILGARCLEIGLDVQVLMGLALVAGHNWSIYLRFTGGRGMASGLGVLLGMGLLELAFGTLGISLLGVCLRNVALWMGIAAVVLPLASLALGQPLPVVLFCTGLLGLLLTKRLEGNRHSFPSGLPYWEVLLNRLLYDRDIRNREDWISRSPSSKNPRG